MSLAEEFDTMSVGMPLPKKTHRGRRSKGFGAKSQEGAKEPQASQEHHEVAKEQIRVALKESDPKKAHAHLFKAISSLNKACK